MILFGLVGLVELFERAFVYDSLDSHRGHISILQLLSIPLSHKDQLAATDRPSRHFHSSHPHVIGRYTSLWSRRRPFCPIALRSGVDLGAAIGTCRHSHFVWGSKVGAVGVYQPYVRQPRCSRDSQGPASRSRSLTCRYASALVSLTPTVDTNGGRFVLYKARSRHPLWLSRPQVA